MQPPHTGIRETLLRSFGTEPRTRPGWDVATVLVTVKAYPAVGRKTGEAVCVAGVRIDSPAPQWVRLFPVGFRALPRNRKFTKYQVIRLPLKRGNTDRRPESWTPHLDSIEVGAFVASDHGWRDRWRLLEGVAGSSTTCELLRASRQYGQETPSLGMVRPVDISDLVVKDNPAYVPGAAAASQVDLFGVEEKMLEATPFVVQYHYRCEEASCNGHKQMTVDWESGVLARKNVSRYGAERAKQLQRARFYDEMCNSSRDPYFFVGNQHQAPAGYLVLGTYWPPRGSDPRGLF